MYLIAHNTLVRYDLDKEAWVPGKITLPKRFVKLSGSSDTDLWAIGGSDFVQAFNHIIYHSTDGGERWKAYNWR